MTMYMQKQKKKRELITDPGKDRTYAHFAREFVCFVTGVVLAKAFCRKFGLLLIVFFN